MALTQVTSAGLKDGEIVNADLHSAAAVAGTKIAPDFGSQNIDTTGNILLDSDSNKLKLGDGEDFQLYHNGSHSYVQNNTGNFHIGTDGFLAIYGGKDYGETSAKFINDGAVELYNDNSLKAQTTSTGFIVYGNLHMNGDNRTIKLGGSDDLQIFHDGSQSIIRDTGTGSLMLQGSSVIMESADGGEVQAKFIDDGAVELYYDNSKKFHTHSTGVTISGYLHFQDGLPTTSGIGIGNSDDLKLYHDGSHSIIQNGTGDLVLYTASGSVKLLKTSGGESMLHATVDGAVELYYDNAKRFETTSGGVKLGNITQTLLWPYDGNSNSRSWGFIGEAGSYGIFELKCSNGADTTLDEIAIRANANAGLQFFHNNIIRCEVQSTGLEVSGGQIQLKGNEGGEAQLQLIADEGDDNDDTWRVIAHVDNKLDISNTASGSWEKNVQCHGNGAVELFYNNTKKFETTSAGAMIAGTSDSNVLSLRNTTLGNGSVGILFSTQNHTGGREKAAIYHVETHGQAHYGGDITFCLAQSTGSAQQVTPSDERARIKKGGGITFNGDTADANALNDYEEGNWTPDPHDGNVTVTYARYTKIGRQVTISMRLHSFTDSSTNDQLKLSGIPFSVSEQQGGVGTTMQRYSNDPTAAQAFIFTDNKIYFYGNSTGDYAQLRHNEFNNALFNMHCTMTYYTDL